MRILTLKKSEQICKVKYLIVAGQPTNETILSNRPIHVLSGQCH